MKNNSLDSKGGSHTLNLDVSMTIIEWLQRHVRVSADQTFWEIGMGAPKLCFFLGGMFSRVFATDADADLYAQVVEFFDNRPGVEKIHFTIRENSKPYEIQSRRGKRKCRENIMTKEMSDIEYEVEVASESEHDTNYVPSESEHDTDTSDDSGHD
jgi:hypothetical protein